LIIFLIPLGAAQNATLTLEADDSEAQTVPADYTIENSSGVVAQSQDSLTAELSTSSNYTIKQEFSGKGLNVTLYDFNLTQDVSPRIQVVNRTSSTPHLQNGERIYALNASDLRFSEASISYERGSQPENITKCDEFDYSGSDCGSWEINSSADYASDQSDGSFEFNITDFSAYTAGDTAPRPDIEEIEVFNVTGLSQSEKKYGGEKIDEGLNKTFQTVQEGSSGSFRFDFYIENNGSEAWTLQDADTLRHAGIDSSWSDEYIFYNLSGEKSGGSFSSGIISWDTSLGGSLDAGENFTASYVISTSLSDTQLYQQDFKAQDASSGEESQDFHELRAVKIGEIALDIDNPPNNTLITQNKTFNFSANISCSNGSCGSLRADPRYNESSQVLMPSSGKPFEVIDSKDSCSLQSGEGCTVSWDVNATGDLDSFHEIDFNASSATYPELKENSSEEHIVEIDLPVAFNLSWSVIDFGGLDPGEEDQEALGNDDLQYNVTVDEDSKPVDIWVKGTDLISTVNTDYSIGISNVTYALTNSVQDSKPIEKNYSEVASDVQAGERLNTFYWIDVPFGMTEGGYNGTVTFKANLTG
jgi:hypothetical protein